VTAGSWTGNEGVALAASFPRTRGPIVADLSMRRRHQSQTHVGPRLRGDGSSQGGIAKRIPPPGKQLPRPTDNGGSTDTRPSSRMACSEIRAAVLHAKTRIALRSIRIRLHHLRVTARAGSWIGKRRGQADFVFSTILLHHARGPGFTPSGVPSFCVDRNFAEVGLSEPSHVVPPSVLSGTSQERAHLP
jgi:hypothetical protein